MKSEGTIRGVLACPAGQLAFGRGGRFCQALLIGLVSVARPLGAGEQTFTWTNGLGGAWGDPANWAGGVPAAGPEAIADFAVLDLLADADVRLDGAWEVGGLRFGDTAAPFFGWQLIGGENGTLVLTNSIGLAPVTVTASSVATVRVPMLGPSGLVKKGAGLLVLLGHHAFAGASVVEEGRLVLGDGTTDSGSLVSVELVNDGVLELNPVGLQEMTNRLAGAGMFEKTGLGEVCLVADNAHRGPTVVRAGVMRLGHERALGAPDGPTEVEPGATLDFNGFSPVAEPIFVSGAGVAGRGALVNGSLDRCGAFCPITLRGDTTIGGQGRWDIRTHGLPDRPTLRAQGHTLTKVGTNAIWLMALGETDLAEVEVREGLLGFEETTSMGDPSRTISVASNAQLGLFNVSGVYRTSKRVRLQDGAGVFCSTTWAAEGVSEFAGSCLVEGRATFNVIKTASLILSGSLMGEGPLIKTGTGALVVHGSNGCTGPLRIQGGTLSGTGIISGPVSVETGTLRPGGVELGALTIRDKLVLAADTLMRISAANGTCDQVVGMTQVALGGRLVVTNVAGVPKAGQRFTLFSADRFLGAFTSISLPQLPAGLAWTNRVMENGTLEVIRVVTTTPPRLVYSVQPSALVLSWPASHLGWRLEIQITDEGIAPDGPWWTLPGSNDTNVVVWSQFKQGRNAFFRLVWP